MKSDLLLKFFPVPKFLLQPAVGLDISDQSIKFIELIRDDDKFKIGRFGELDIPLGVIEGGELKNAESFLAVLSGLKEKWHLDNVFISLPDDHAYTINLRLPSLKPEEVYGSIELQIEEYVSLPAPEVVFDFEIIGQDKESGGLDVGVVALPRKIVESYQDVFLKAGINLLAIETQGGALARALYESGKFSNVAIIDLGKNHTAIFWVKQGVVIHATAAPVGGAAITRNLQKGLGVSYDEAEKIKVTQGLLRSTANQPAFEAMIPVVSAIRDEIERLTSFWLSQAKEEGINLEQIILTGGQASLPGLAEYLGNHLSYPIIIGNPWSKIFPAGTTVSELPYNEALRYVTAIGLALRNFR